MTLALETLAREMREALQVQNLSRSRELLIEFRREFDRHWFEMTDSERERSSLPLESLEFLDWARAMALAVRQQTADEYRRVRTGGRYVHSRRRVAPPAGYCV